MSKKVEAGTMLLYKACILNFCTDLDRSTRQNAQPLFTTMLVSFCFNASLTFGENQSNDIIVCKTM